MKLKSKDGEFFEIDPKNQDLPDGHHIVTPNHVPDGIFMGDTVENIVQDRLKNTAKNVLEKAIKDPEHQKRVLSEFNIVLDDDNKPKGLNPTVDIEEVKQSVAEQVSQDYENKLEEYQSKLSKRDQAVVKSAIMEAASGNYADHFTKSFDDEEPLVVQKFRSKIGVDEDGNPFVKDEKGEKRYKGDGPMSVKDYLLNEEKFGELMKDKRQRGSQFGNAGNPTNGTPSGDPSKWGTKKKLEYIKKNGQDGYKQALQKFKESQSEE